MSFDYYKDRTEWNALNAGSSNVSHYVFHDVNRNGIYDLGDRPLIQFAIKVTREDGSWAVRRSNLNGFVNFFNAIVDPNSPEADKVEIKGPGKYLYEIILPEGWFVTTGNAVQEIIYSALPNTRPGIVCDRVPSPIGVAQVLRVSGKVLLKSEHGLVSPANSNNVTLVTTSPAGKIETHQVNEIGEYSFIGEPGIWKIHFKSEFGEMERLIELSRAPINMSRVILGSNEDEIEYKPNVELVDFENLTNRNVQKMFNGIAGVTWKNFNIIHHLFEGEGYSNGCVSGEYVVYNTSGYPTYIEKSEGFDFYGGYFSAGWLRNAQGETLQVKAWRGTELIADEEFKLSVLGPFWFDADYRNITKLEIGTQHYWQFVGDDFKIGV